ncbi:hypothetical protein AQUCO_01500365v1 [Aquilegia coerulea]|uniref:RRM domain-containing protein n=1 Tax=Aquilegia coerulea TaxID=218851 RepID=A0A2G5DU42_AQUCA|nr:hypothetical protein AQUCO_01500365v1 [Aquilegia coerulea]
MAGKGECLIGDPTSNQVAMNSVKTIFASEEKDEYIPTMCNYCWQKADHGIDMCPGWDMEPLPCPGSNALQTRPCSFDKERNAIRNSFWIGDLSEETNYFDVLDINNIYGRVSGITIKTDRKDDLPKRFGRVSSVNSDDAKRGLYSVLEKDYSVDWLEDVKVMMCRKLMLKFGNL